MANYKDYEALKNQKIYLTKEILKFNPTPEQILSMIEPGIQAEIYLKLRDNLECSATGHYEDFSNGDDSKTGLDQEYGNGNSSKEHNYRIPFRSCGNKKGNIMGIGFNRRANTVDEYYIPNEAIPFYGDIEVNYRKETNEPSGKYAKYRISSKQWI